MNKSAYLLLVLGICSAFIVFFLLLPEQASRALRKQTLEVIGPVLTTADKPVNFFAGMDSKLKTLDQAQAEVTHLRSELAALQVQNQLLTDKNTENSRLREMLGFKAASQYELLPCRVVSRDPENWWTTVQIDVGWEINKQLDEKFHGKYSLTSDQPVVSPRGVIGKTGIVAGTTTDVILMVDENCRIPAVIDGTHDQAIVKGQGNYGEGKPRVLVDYLPKESQVAPGQFVVTSGIGPYFPSGLRLGTVMEVPPVQNAYPTFGLYRQAIIEPTADLNQLDELFIVLGPKEDADKPDAAKPDAGADTSASPPADASQTADPNAPAK